MRAFRKALLLPLIFLAPRPAAAQIRIVIGGYMHLHENVTVNNTLSTPVTFRLVSSECSVNPPAMFTAAANTNSVLSIEWTFYDDVGLGACYTDHHSFTYADVDNPANLFRIQQYSSSNNYACTGFAYYLLFWIDQAVCPEFGGQVQGPTTNSGDNGVNCPPGTPDCPPYDGGTNSQFYGFVIRNPDSPCVDQACVVTSSADDGSNATLRAALAYANVVPGTSITFAPAMANATIKLASQLPIVIGYNTTIDGGTNNITIDGGHKHRAFFVGDAGVLNHGQTILKLNNLTINNAAALGGAGGAPGGGGGAGLGGAVFVSSSGFLRLGNVAINNGLAAGGAGGAGDSTDSTYGAGGGGGMGGVGGANHPSVNGGGGGGGFGQSGIGGTSAIKTGSLAGGIGSYAVGLSPFGGAVGGDGGGQDGGPGGDSAGGGGAGKPGSTAMALGGGGGGAGGQMGGTNEGNGGNGGFGGGGGGGSIAAAEGGGGGYGGGGGGDYAGGGFGGGGGGGNFGQDGQGGFAAGAGGSTSNGEGVGGGGGGAALGAAIFVQSSGVLHIDGPVSIAGGTLAAGTAGANGGLKGKAFGAGIFIAGNTTLTFNPPAGQVQVIANGIADQAGSGGGSNSGAGVVSIVGAGTVALTHNNTYTGGTTVTTGTLEVDGTVVGQLNVAPGAALQGTGTVGATLVAGNLTPGEAIVGKSSNGLNVIGALLLTSASTYNVAINESQATAATVAGIAKVAGTVHASFPADFSGQGTLTYPILHAESVGGTFAGLTLSNPPAGYTASLQYSSTDVSLVLTPGT